jgi:hypothetical protein
MSVPPYEGAFLDRKGGVGWAATDRLRDSYRAIGFIHDPKGEGAEHLSTELRALASASAMEARLVAAAADTADVEALRSAQRDFLDAHLLLWLPSFAAATRGVDRPLPNALVEQILDVVLLHRTELGAPRAPAPTSLEGPPLDLDDPDVDMREIATHLSVPARAGLLISRADVARVGRGQRVPRGFGERRTLIHNLLRSAVALDVLPDVIRDLRALIGERDVLLANPRYAVVPGLEARLAPIRERLADTDRALARLASTRDLVAERREVTSA